jgi:hypothetical protein
MGVIIPNLLTEDRVSGAQIVDGSLRFDSSKSQRLEKTFSAGNRRTWTWSAWVKRGKQDAQMLFSSFADNSNRFYIAFYPSYILCFGRVGGVDSLEIQTNALYRDSSAWYHLVVSMDTTQSNASDRFKIYINGISQSLTVTTTPGSNVEAHINTTSTHRIGSYDASSNFFDGHITNAYFIDGQALDSSYFGYTDALTNTWRPKKFKPQATPNYGATWSNNWTASGNGFGSNPVSNIFDSSSANFMNNSNGGQIVTWNTSSYTLGGRLRVYGYSSSGLYDIYVNGTKAADTGSSLAWIDCGTFSSITEIQFAGTTYNTANGLGSAGIYVYLIEINGVPLLDNDTINMGANGFYLPFDGSAPIGQDQSRRGNNWTPVNFGGSNTLEKATGALPILNTDGGGKVARVGVRTDSSASSLVLALPLVGIKSDFSNAINSGTSNKAVTNNGTVTFPSTYSNFYGGSAYFNGSHRLECDFSQSWTSDFTVEGWIYRSATGSYPTIFDFAAAANGYGMYAFIDTAASSVLRAQFFSSNSSGSVFGGLWLYSRF